MCISLKIQKKVLVNAFIRVLCGFLTEYLNHQDNKTSFWGNRSTRGRKCTKGAGGLGGVDLVEVIGWL